MEQNDNDNDIRELFSDFRPALTSDDNFMQQLDKRLDAVETLKLITTRQKRANRIAVAAALLAGFTSGVACTLLMPKMMNIATNFLGPLALTYSNMPETLCWLGMAAVSSLVATGVFSAARTTAYRSARN